MYLQMYVLMFVCNKLISETAATIFPKLGMKLSVNKGRKLHDTIYVKKFSFFIKIWPCVSKMSILAQNNSFWELAKNCYTKFSEITLKVCPKIVL